MLAARSLALALSGLLLACGSDAGDPEFSERRAPDSTASSAAPTALAPVAEDAARAPSTSAPAAAGGDVAVTVVDASGAPLAGVPVLGCDLDADGEVRGRLRWTFAVPTDAEGVAVVPERRAGPRYAAALFGDTFASSTADRPHHVVLPPHGALEIDVSALGADARVRVAPEGGPSDRFKVPAGETLVVPRVPLGLRFDVRVESDAGRASVTADGPVEAGATVRVVPAFERKVEVVAVLVDESGAPLEGLRAWVRPFDDDDEYVWLGPSDAQGRVAKHVPLGQLEAIDDPDVEVIQAGFDEPCHPEARRARMEFPALGDGDRLDLGTITMARPRVLVAGRIVRADGSPVQGAVFGVDVPLSDDVEFDLADAWYEATLRTKTTSDEGGAFEVRAHTFGLPPWPATLDLEVSLPGAPNLLKVPFEVGRTDFEVRIESPGTLEVDLSKHSESVWAQLSVSVTPDRETARATGKVTSEFDPDSPDFEGLSPEFIAELDLGPTIGRIAAASWGDGVWTFTPAAGTYSVEVALGGAVVARIDDVTVRAGEPVDDPRLERIEFLFPLEPRVLTVLAGGEPVRGARLTYRDANSDLWWDSLAGLWSDAPLTALVAPGGELLVAVRARGYVPVTINDLPAGEPITLERPVAVTLEFGAPQGADAEWAGKLVLEPTDPTSAWELDSAIVLDRLPATAEVELPPGAELRVESHGSPWEGQTFVVPLSGGSVVLEAE